MQIERGGVVYKLKQSLVVVIYNFAKEGKRGGGHAYIIGVPYTATFELSWCF